jgi:hypothetical protein
MKMAPEIFNARLLQMSIERDAINALIQGMVAQNVVRECNGGGEPDYTMKEFDQAKHSLMALGRGIDNLINEYQAGVSPAAGLSMSEDDIIDAFDAYTCQAKFLNGNQNEATVVAYSDICLIVKDIYAKLEGAGK